MPLQTNRRADRVLEKALWTKELEVELVKGNVDAIVHSLKDVPTEVRSHYPHKV